MLKVLILIGASIVLAITNPDRADFIFYSHTKIKKMYPEISFRINEDETKIEAVGKIFGNALVTAALDQNTNQKNYTFFTVFTLDTRYLRAIDPEIKNIKVLGVFGILFPII